MCMPSMQSICLSRTTTRDERKVDNFGISIGPGASPMQAACPKDDPHHDTDRFRMN